MSDDHEPPDDGHGERPHAFGPTRSTTPPPGVGFRSTLRLIPSPPAEADPVEDDEAPDDYRPRHARRDAPPAVPATPQVRVEPGETQPPVEDAEPGSGRHRRRLSAIGGTVRSTRGRGLRGMQVAALDDRWDVVATTVTGPHGQFLLEDLPAGTYRVTARDEVDGDFGSAWHDGPASSRVAVLRVKAGRTHRRADVVLASTSAVELDVELRPSEAVVSISVTDRGTGLPARGSVRVTTKRFSTELPLRRGRASLTVHGGVEGSGRRSRKVRVDYPGTTHVQAGTASARLR